ncbi:TonB-linked SusC/RagA family outer membrane protein [Leeuwenhoekiella polynyae]|uniref:TonB-linked SusC/RagA family outer membrane protein n=2 Tax=Leeuwenhoekiella polynyae TaxID=1550906 RepID=A0A4Q0PHW6_9FLAO|nr:TonB-linked SusC/RagA family outer membrane protein [Leeuwenhoekiella polynyae]
MKIPICTRHVMSCFQQHSLAMKLTTLLLFASLFSLQANSYSQRLKVTLNLNHVSVQEVLEQIEESTAYKFIYNVKTFDTDKLLNINFNEEEIQVVLDQILASTHTDYVIRKNLIVLKPSPQVAVSALIEASKNAMQMQITGTVQDSKGVMLPGVTVKIKDSQKGVSTDFDGNYSITADPEATLVFSYVGFETLETTIDGRNQIDITLKESLEEMSEVVVIGYGQVKKENITGSVGIVDMESFQNQAPTINIDQGLQGLVAGVNVSSPSGQPGSASKIRIRGTTSLFGSNQPLYVIDGIPVVSESNIPIGGTEGGNLGQELDNQGLSTPIGNINPSDIKSITVLKDASAAAIYGSRAANGVIVITTKQGTKDGKTQFEFSASTTVQNTPTLDVLNADQFKDVWLTAVNNSSSTDAFSQSIRDGSYFGTANTNWEEELNPSNQVSSNYNLSIRGGNATTQYSTSMSALNEQGALEGAARKRYTLNLNLNTKATEKWSFGTRLQTTYSDQDAADSGLFDRIYVYRPDLPVFDEEGNYSFSDGYNLENPKALSQAVNSNKTFLFLGTFFTQLELVEGLKAETRLSINYNTGKQNSYYPEFLSRGGWSRLQGDGDGYAQDSRAESSVVQWNSNLTYSKTFNDLHSIESVLGTTFEKVSSSYNKAFGEGYSNGVLSNVSSATSSNGGLSTSQGSGLHSYFGRVHYDYDDRYLLTLLGRVDGSSKFAVENKYAFFPAAAVAWRATEESFLKNNKTLNNLKFKASLGTTGQQDFGAYQWRTLYETYFYAGSAVILTQLGNDKLKWETTQQLDFGIEFGLLNNRISGELGYYEKNTKDAIFNVIPPGNTGSGTILANVGETQNKGLELLVNFNVIRAKDFSWDLRINATKNSNKLVKISDDYKDDEGFVTGIPGNGGRLREGSPIGLIYGYVAEGIFQDQVTIDGLNSSAPGGVYQDEETSPGDIRFKDISGPDGIPDGIISSFDQQVIGDARPDVYGGFTNTFRYKQLSLSAQFSYAIGNDLLWFSQSRSINFQNSFLGENKTIDVLNAWTAENPTNVPRSVYRDPNGNGKISSFYVHDGSYLRLNTLNLRYDFSKEFLERFPFINGLAIYGIAQNLFTVTNYPGANPQGGSLFDNDISGSGRDTNRYPLQSAYTVGVNLRF